MNDNFTVKGTIDINGVKSEFDCSIKDGWNQWGATAERLCESQPIVEAISKALWEEL